MNKYIEFLYNIIIKAHLLPSEFAYMTHFRKVLHDDHRTIKAQIKQLFRNNEVLCVACPVIDPRLTEAKVV